MSYFDETLKDWVITQQAGLGAFGEARAVMSRRNRRILELLGPGVSSKNVTKVIARIRKLDVRTKKQVLGLIEKQLLEAAAITYRNEAGNMAFLNVNTASVSATLINPARVLNKTMSSIVPSVNRSLRSLLSDTFGNAHTSAANIIARSVSEGMTQRQLTSALRQRFKVDMRYLSTNSATAMNSIANHSRQQFYMDNDDIIRGVLNRATLDAKTSSICMSLDGKIYDVNEPHPIPPFHPNCRTFQVPVIKGMSDKKARRMMRPSVSDKGAKQTTSPTYGAWLKNQSAGFQRKVLGDRRYELFRDEKISFDRFFSTDGRLLTLSELEK